MSAIKAQYLIEQTGIGLCCQALAYFNRHLRNQEIMLALTATWRLVRIRDGREIDAGNVSATNVASMSDVVGVRQDVVTEVMSSKEAVVAETIEMSN